MILDIPFQFAFVAFWHREIFRDGKYKGEYGVKDAFKSMLPMTIITRPSNIDRIFFFKIQARWLLGGNTQVFDYELRLDMLRL